MVVTIQGVHHLSEQGWSVRAIAALLDMSKSAVNRIVVAGPMAFEAEPPSRAAVEAAIEALWQDAIPA
jgi:hypothetical protein